MALLPLTARLRRFGVKFGDVTTVLHTILLAGEEAVPEDLQCKDLPASACWLLQCRTWPGKSVLGEKISCRETIGNTSD